MELWKRAGAPILSVAMIVFGILVLDWANVGGPFGASVRLAPLGNEMCAGGSCVELKGSYGTWSMLAKMILLAGGLTALAMAGVAIVHAIGVDLGPINKAVTWLCVLLLALSGMGVFSTGASIGELGGGGPLVMLGALVGMASRVTSGGVFDSGRSGRPIRSTATVAAPPAADPYREAGAVPARPAPRRADAPVVEADRARPAPSAALMNKGMVRLAPAGPVAADATRGALRFVVTEGALTETGLVLRFDRGEPRHVRWSDITEVVARRMPPDPPYEKTAFVDLVLADGLPARLLPTSRLDLAALPGGVAPNTKENWRRLVALVREHNPNLAIEADSADFFAGGRDPLMFPALKKFVDWDRRYDR